MLRDLFCYGVGFILLLWKETKKPTNGEGFGEKIILKRTLARLGALQER